jgi:hypothetical protein
MWLVVFSGVSEKTLMLTGGKDGKNWKYSGA